MSQEQGQDHADAVVPKPGQEQAAEQTDETAASPANADEHSDEESGEKPKRPGGFQKRIAKLSSKLTSAQAETEYWRQQALARQQETAKSEQATSEKPRPREQDYDLTTTEGWSKYTEDVADWKTDQKFAQVEKQRQEREQQAKSQSEQERLNHAWTEKLSAAKAKHADFDEAVEDLAIPVTRDVQVAMQESDFGAEILYYFAQHPEEAEQVGKLTGRAADRAIGRVETLIAAEEIDAEETVQAPPPPQTKAPPPPTPVRKAAGSGTPNIHDPKLPYKDFVKLRNAQEAERRKG